jgi:hypothetical protein
MAQTPILQAAKHLEKSLGRLLIVHVAAPSILDFCPALRCK